LDVCRELLIYPGSAQHIEGENRLGNGTVQDGDEVSFESLDGPFGEVVAVVICVC
jgi:hypothetical protein